MKSPFPGMDPYLEHHTLWPDVHNSLIIAIRDAIVPLVAPDYYVSVESRAYIIKTEGDLYLGRPDIAVVAPGRAMVKETAQPIVAGDLNILEVTLPIGEEVNHYYLEVRSVKTHELITLIELLSPANKAEGRGRTEYMEKREEALMTLTNYVEIDLLRAGEPMPVMPEVVSDYRVLVSRGRERGKGRLYAFGLRTPIPDFPLPLQPGEAEPLVTLNEILHDLYGRARFDLRLDYTQPPIPPLAETDLAWALKLLS